MNIDFSSKTSFGRELIDWWARLQDDRGARAELRRCKSVADVAMTAAFARLCHAMRDHFQDERGWQDRLAAIAGLSSHLRTQMPGRTLPERMAEGSPPTVSELRFRRLLQRERDDLYPALVRVLRMLGYSADLHSLANDIYYWGDGVKKRWAYAYFPNIPARTA